MALIRPRLLAEGFPSRSLQEVRVWLLLVAVCGFMEAPTQSLDLMHSHRHKSTLLAVATMSPSEYINVASTLLQYVKAPAESMP